MVLMNRLFAFRSPLWIQIYRFLMKEFSSALTLCSSRYFPFSIRLPSTASNGLIDGFSRLCRAQLKIERPKSKAEKPKRRSTHCVFCGKFLRLFRDLSDENSTREPTRGELSKHRVKWLAQFISKHLNARKALQSCA
jgi:hypothetical protein